MSKPRKRRGHWWGAARQSLYDYPLEPWDELSRLDKAAVDAAINDTRALLDGEVRLRIIDAVFFKKTHRLVGAAQREYISYQSARNKVADFIRLWVKHRGLYGKY